MKNMLKTSGAMFLTATLAINASTAFASDCGFRFKFSQADERGNSSVRVFQSKPMGERSPVRILAYVTYLKVNTDGTRISYHQDDPKGTRCAGDPDAKPCAINNIRNAYNNHRKPVSDFEAIRDAGYPLPATWGVLSDQIIEKDKQTGKPCVSEEGYLVSMTSDVSVPGGFNRQGDCDQTKWIDALSVPGIVLPRGPKVDGTRVPSKFAKLGVRKRSLSIGLTPRSRNTGVIGIVGDTGPENELGEANIAFNRALNGLPDDAVPAHRQDAKDRFQVKKAATIVVPGSHYRLSRPLSVDSVSLAGERMIDELGGLAKLRKCIRRDIDSDF